MYCGIDVYSHTVIIIIGYNSKLVMIISKVRNQMRVTLYRGVLCCELAVKYSNSGKSTAVAGNESVWMSTVQDYCLPEYLLNICTSFLDLYLCVSVEDD